MRNKRCFLLLTPFLLFLLLACMWDEDTLEMEEQEFPSVIQLISGQFLRHSPEYHYWRLHDSYYEVLDHPDQLQHLDDIAVSLSKLGRQKEAIKVMQVKDSIEPDLYTTYANLGTFYLHDGRYEKGVHYIEKAIEINPNAHFGREVYQEYLARFLMMKKAKEGSLSFPLEMEMPRLFPAPADGDEEPSGPVNFHVFLSELSDGFDQDSIDNAIKGILGMMRFGDHTSPVLLEALGDLLYGRGHEEMAKFLPAMAYLKASYEVESEEAKELYRYKAQEVLDRALSVARPEMSLSDLEWILQSRIQKGREFYQRIRKDEVEWILSGKDAETRFFEKYYGEKDTAGRGQKLYEPGSMSVSDSVHVEIPGNIEEEVEMIDPGIQHSIDSLFLERRELAIDRMVSSDVRGNSMKGPWMWWAIGGVLLLIGGVWLVKR